MRMFVLISHMYTNDAIDFIERGTDGIPMKGTHL